jgi:hypothetical protein
MKAETTRLCRDFTSEFSSLFADFEAVEADVFIRWFIWFH